MNRYGPGLLLTGVLCLCGTASAQSVNGGRSATSFPSLSNSEKAAVKNCLEIIRKCQLPDGAIVQLNRSGQIGAPIWIAPYFANYAALALISDIERTKSVPEMGRIGKWLDWCAKHQSADGYWNDYEGTSVGYKNNEKVDAWDSSAAMFLLVTARFQKIGGKVKPAVVEAAKKSLRCIEALCDDDGLTWATPTYKMKFLMDNVEVYAGLKSSIAFFDLVDAKDESRAATARADAMAKSLPGFWRPDEQLYAYVLDEKGRYEGGLSQAYPNGLAQLFGIAFIAARQEAMTAAKKFPPDDGVTTATGTERWYVAASRLGGNEAKEWKEKLVKDATGFTSANVYVNRPAIAALALFDGANWMPSLARSKESR